MKTLKLSQKKCFIWMLLYILFISHGSNILDFSNMNIVAPFTFIVLLLFFKFECKLTFELWIFFGMLFVNYIITGILSDAGISTGFNFAGFFEILSVVLTVILLYKLDTDVMTKFIQIVYFFSCISLICYIIISSGAGTILTKLFSTYNTGMGTVSGKFLFVYNLNNPDRNAGIFTEPGIYQAILIMCIYVILFYRERINLSDKKIARYLIVLLITLITTKTAAGYIGLTVISVGILLKRKEKRDIAIAGILITGVAYLIFNYYTKGNDSILQEYFFGKFAETQERSLQLSSGGARLVAMQMGWKAAITHPFGIGYLNWEKQLYKIYGHKFGTGNALFTQLGTRGFISFFISLYLVIKPSYLRKKGWIEFLVFVVLFLYIAIVQSKILYPAIVLVSLLPNVNFEKNNKLL